ncbi:smalltalk protein [Segatella copri]
MKKMKKETWKSILQIIVTVLTALCTSLGVTSCM